MFGIILISHLDKKTAPTKKIVTSRIRLVIGHLMMILVGFWGGVIQIGVGFLIMPVLSNVIGLDLIRTNMHKVFIIGTYTVVALAIFASNLEIPWMIGLALASGNMLGGYLGARISISQGDRFIRIVLNVVLACFIVRLLVLTGSIHFRINTKWHWATTMAATTFSTASSAILFLVKVALQCVGKIQYF